MERKKYIKKGIRITIYRKDIQNEMVQPPTEREQQELKELARNEKRKTVGNKEEIEHFSSIHLYKTEMTLEQEEMLLLIKQCDVSDTIPHYSKSNH